VQVVSVAGVVSFLVAVALSSEVFRHWDLNFLQYASTGDIIASGLDVFSRMLLPVAAMVVAAYAAVSFEFAWSRLEILFGATLLVLLFMLTLYFEAENNRLNEEGYQLMMTGDEQITLQSITSGRIARLYVTTLLVTQVAAVFAGARVLRNMLAALPKEPRKRALVFVTSAAIAAALLYLPWTVFKAETENVSAWGFQDFQMQTLDCPGEVTDDLAFEDQADVLWLGDRAMVVRCADGRAQVVIHESSAVLHPLDVAPVDATPADEAVPTQAETAPNTP
jgi:hypothetical protein